MTLHSIIGKIARLRIFENEYRAGTVDYTNVVIEQAVELNAEQSMLALQASRLTTTVALIAALGGGWNARELPKS